MKHRDRTAGAAAGRTGRPARWKAATRISLGVAASGALAATAALSAAAPAGASTQIAHATKYTFTTLDNRQRPHVQPAARDQQARRHRRLLRQRRRRAPQQGLRAPLALRAGQLHQRELPRLRADPGHRHQQQGLHGRLLVDHEQRPAWPTNYGFIEWNGVFTSTSRPAHLHPPVNQLLGVNDNGVAVGFYNDAKGTTTAMR